MCGCVCVCVCVCVCGCFGNMQYVYCHSPATLTEVFLFFFLSCKANARVKLAKMLHCQRSSKLVVICVVLLLFVLFYVLFVFLSSYILHTEHIDSASAFQATGRQQLGCIIPHSVKHSIALLRMGKNCPKHVELIGISVNCYCSIQLVFYVIYKIKYPLLSLWLVFRCWCTQRKLFFCSIIFRLDITYDYAQNSYHKHGQEDGNKTFLYT